GRFNAFCGSFLGGRFNALYGSLLNGISRELILVLCCSGTFGTHGVRGTYSLLFVGHVFTARLVEDPYLFFGGSFHILCGSFGESFRILCGSFFRGGLLGGSLYAVCGDFFRRDLLGGSL